MLESRIRAIVEWSEDGPGQHNFLRIVANQLSEELRGLLAGRGYEIRDFKDSHDPVRREELERLLVEAQTYMNHKVAEKIAVIVSREAVDEYRKSQSFADNWRLNSQYLESVE